MPDLTFGIALDFGSKLRPLAAQLERQSALFEAAEQAGFQIVAAGESSSAGGFHLPDALQVLAAITQRTRLRLCTGVALLPAWPVWRLALDAAQLDQLSGGRLILGVGLGTSALQSRAGWPTDAVGETADEYLECLRQLWAGAPDFAGKHVSATGLLPVRPVAERLPIWVGGGIRRSAMRAAKLGDGWYAGVSFPLSRLPGQVQAYTANGGVGAVAVNRVVLVAPPSQVDDLVERYVRPTMQAYANAEQSLREVFDEVALIGTPDQVSSQLERYSTAGVSHVFARLSLDDMPPETVRGTIELMGREVLPRFT